LTLGRIRFADPSRQRCQAMKIASFETDLTDAQWRLVEPLLPPPSRLGRPRTPLRPVVDAILYLIKSGCPWRLLPKNFPPWKTVYHFFWHWSRGPIFSGLNDRLRALVRASEGKRCRPTAAALDSQTVRSEAHGGAVGYDPGKRTKGRKRFLLVDTLGMILGAAVVPANETERSGAKVLLKPLLGWFPWLRKIWVDSGYCGPDFAAWVREQRPKLEIEVIKRSDDLRGFHVLPKRWIVERTFAWLVQNRRLARDYEQSESSATGLIYVAMIRLMLRRLA
jgi:transposase